MLDFHAIVGSTIFRQSHCGCVANKNARSRSGCHKVDIEIKYCDTPDHFYHPLYRVYYVSLLGIAGYTPSIGFAIAFVGDPMTSPVGDLKR